MNFRENHLNLNYMKAGGGENSNMFQNNNMLRGTMHACFSNLTSLVDDVCVK